MKKLFITILLLAISFPLLGQAEILIEEPSQFRAVRNIETVVLSWENMDNIIFSKSILFRSPIPIEDYFTYEAVRDFCDKIYEGTAETHIDTNLDKNLPYYYILFSQDKNSKYSKAIILSKEAIKDEEALTNSAQERNINTLVGATPVIVNEVSFNEAGTVYNYNRETKTDGTSSRLALVIVVKSPHELSKKDINAISYFIHSGTPTTIILGSGERAGVLDSYLSVFEKLPRTTLEWQDVIKISNGRWPDERSDKSEQTATDHFGAIYRREPDMNNANDNAAVTVIAYGLRPAQRNLKSEKNSINIFRSIFNKPPSAANDWDLVRAIAYSGATR